ncbi:MAG: phage tail protein [Saprospiraceae bacterium]|nr:phage tail protein [Saprospiraceae bacterium]
MANEKQDAPWPIPQFYFKVIIGNYPEIHFQEVSGLDTEYDVIEYRAGNSPEFSTVKMPGLKKHSDITLKKGIFTNDSNLFDYFLNIKMNTITRETVTIHLVDEQQITLFTWTLTKAIPKKVTGASLNAKTSEAAIEELILAHEGLTMAKH